MCQLFFFFKQKTAYEMRISDWSSDVCSSDLSIFIGQHDGQDAPRDRWVRRVVAGELHLAVVIIEFPEHPFALILSQSRALGCPATIGNLVDRPEIAFAVRVVVLVEGVEGFDQLADARLTSPGRSEERREGKEGVR